MESYKDLHALIKSQIDEGRLALDWKRATPSDKISEWIEKSRKCLLLMEDRVPSIVKEFAGLNFHLRIPEEELVSEVVEEGDGLRLLQTVDEDRWSPSWFRDGGDHPVDFNFSALQHAVELLELADEKLQLDSEPEAAHGPSPKLPADTRRAGKTQEMAADKSALPDTALSTGGNSTHAEVGSVVNGPNTVGAHRRAVLEPILADKGYTKSKWAKEAGVDPSVVYDYLSGKSNPNAESRKYLAEAIGLPVDKLPK